MTYFPYFRGKQFELIAVRESAATLAKNEFIPIIEPVRSDPAALRRAVLAISEANGHVCVIINPTFGQRSSQAGTLSDLLGLPEHEIGPRVMAGVLATGSMDIAGVRNLLTSCANRDVMVIHDGFSQGRSLADLAPDFPNWKTDVFIEETAGRLYRRHFMSAPNAPQRTRVLIEDGFDRKRNRDYTGVSPFTELNVVYSDLGMDGFGDFLTVGNHYSDGGGPAYAVAIHLTFVSRDHENSLFLEHFVSDSNDTPADPGGKFAQALKKLVARISDEPARFVETTAINEFKELYTRQHYPGLGYVKKLSMIHHMETVAASLNRSIP